MWAIAMDETLTRPFRHAINGQRIRQIGFRVGRGLRASEDVVGAEVDESRTMPSGGTCEVVGSGRIDGEGKLRPILTFVDTVIGCGVDDAIGMRFRNGLIDGDVVTDLELTMRAERQLMNRENPREIAGELSFGADEKNTHLVKEARIGREVC